MKPLLQKMPAWCQDALRPAARMFERALDTSGYWHGSFEQKAFTAIGIIGLGVSLLTLPFLYGMMTVVRRKDGGRSWMRLLLFIMMGAGMLVGLAAVPLGCGLLAQVLSMKRGPLL